MAPGIEKFLKFLPELNVDPNMVDIVVEGSAAGDADQFGFITIELTLNAEAMDKLVADGLIKESGRDQWGVRYKIVEA